MSLSKPESRAELIKYIKTRLGHPVIDVNIADEQIDIAIEDAFSFFSEYSIDAQEEKYVAVKVTANMIKNRYVQTEENINAVTRVFRPSGTSGDSLFDLETIFTKNEILQITSGSGGLSSYYITKSYLSEMDNMMSHELSFRHNRVQNILYVDTNWELYFPVGSYLMYECTAVLDPEEYPELYHNWLIRDLAVANAKYQWGMNLIKFQGIQLPGGATLDGQTILSTAQTELESIKQDFIMKHQQPDGFFVG